MDWLAGRMILCVEKQMFVPVTIMPMTPLMHLLEWDVFANNTFDGLGSHTANCGTVLPPEPKINEFSASTAGTDVEYVEIFGDPDTDYSAYSILEIEGDFSGTATGTIDEVITLWNYEWQWLQSGQSARQRT